MRIARSLVIWPFSTVWMQTFSSVSAKRTTSGVSSNLPRYLSPPVHAKMDAIGLVDVALPCWRSEEHTSELQSLMRISYAVFCLKKKITITIYIHVLIPHHESCKYKIE